MSTRNLRTFGVRPANLPVKRTITVEEADFLIGGMTIDAERRYNVPFEVSSPEEYAQIFGGQVNANDYGPDAVKGFFDNTVETSPTLVVQTFLGFDGSNVDSVVASRLVADAGADADAYNIQAAYQGELEYGVSGNRTGFRITAVDRFSTLAAATVAATGVSTASLDSVIGIVVGDIIRFDTNSGANPVYKKITAIDEANNTVTWAGDFESAPAAGETLAIDDVVAIPGFTLQTYRQSTNGVETEVATELGQQVCSTESEVADFYVENIHAANTWLTVTEASASTLQNRFPTANAATIYLQNGAAGTPVATAAAARFFYEKLNDFNVRFLANPETTDVAIQKELEAYSRSRTKVDNPIVIYVLPENRTKSQLITLGNGYQRSDEVDAIAVGHWVRVNDPFTLSQNAPLRNVPACGHVMGLWIRTIDTLGIHFVPSTNQTLLFGVEGVVGDQFLNDRDRTDIAEAGVNLIQDRVGVGIKLANCRTPSTDVATAFGNGIVMKNFIKVSAADSLQSSENTPNSLNRLRSDTMAIQTFLYGLWFRGSTGDVSEGETFGQTLNADGVPTGPRDHFSVSAPVARNTPASLQTGQRNIEVYFRYPAPGESIEIGVGILLL